MTNTAEATLTDFLRDPNAVVEELERRDVVLHRRNAADLRLSLRSRAEADNEAVGLLAQLMADAMADPDVRTSVAQAATSIPWLTFLPTGDRATFVEEFVRVAQGAAALGSMAGLAQLLVEWKATAAIHADPALAIELKRPIETLGDRVTEPSAD